MEDRPTEISKSPSTRLAYLANWEMKSKKLQQAVGIPLEPKQLTDQMARLTATFGTPKDRTPDQMRMMVAEWFRVLRVYGLKTVTRSFDKAIETSKWFPTIAEIADHCSKDLESWRDAIGIDQHQFGQKQFTDKPPGPVSPEEIARRIEVIAAAKRQFGYDPRDNNPAVQPTEAKPASQEMTVSDELRNSCAVRRTMGLPTCSYDCQGRSCEYKC
jgi:hypothetical protein